MKNKKKNSDYTKLKKKLMLRILSIMLLAFIVVALLYLFVWKGRGGEWIVDLLQNYYYFSEVEAIIFYRHIFRDNQVIIWIGGFLIMFLILMRVVLYWLADTFDCVNKGISAILDDNGSFDLPEEMATTEQKLIDVKAELERRTLEAQLAEQRKNDLVMYLAHDIRTPLTSVIGYLSLLDEAPDMPSEQRAKYVGITLDKAYRLEKMVNEFFEITRYNLQQITIMKEPIDLSYMLVQLTDEMSPILKEKGNRVILNVDENLIVSADPDKLARVFYNVLKNAAAYSFADTEIIITAKEENENVVISFTNQGHALPKEKLDAIFEKFYRLDESRASHSGGSGLGLAIAKEIVTLHYGTITAESFDQTITFTISLPK